MARKTGKREEGPFVNIGAAAKLKGRWGDGARGKERVVASWHSVSPVIVHSLLASVGELGGAITLGVDKNGSGFTVAVWLSGEKVYNQWFSGSEEGIQTLEEHLALFTEDCRALVREA